MTSAAQSVRAFRKKMRRVSGLGVLLPLAVICLLLALTTDTFLTYNNIMQVLRQTAIYAIMATGMTFVIMTGGIDLGQGSYLAFCCVITGLIINATGNIWLAMPVGVLCGAAIGFVNGVIVAYVRIPAFIVTLGAMFVVRGFTLWMTNSAMVAVKHQAFRVIGQGFTFGIPNPVYIFILVGLIGQLVLSKTATGRYVLAIGSNEETARLSGVHIEWNKIKVFMISGACVGIAAIVYLSRLSAAQPVAGQGYEMESVAAAVIGGTSITGGEGSIIGSLIGAVVVAVIRNGLVLLGVQSFFTQIVVGAIIVIAVGLDITRTRLAARRLD
ncbi:MAG: ABC transporter permease [Planctomycetaceae bacterium]|nr:ABC transporter permease [Planctomycetaceae bacterium]